MNIRSAATGAVIAAGITAGIAVPLAAHASPPPPAPRSGVQALDQAPGCNPPLAASACTENALPGWLRVQPVPAAALRVFHITTPAVEIVGPDTTVIFTQSGQTFDG